VLQSGTSQLTNIDIHDASIALTRWKLRPGQNGNPQKNFLNLTLPLKAGNLRPKFDKDFMLPATRPLTP